MDVAVGAGTDALFLDNVELSEIAEGMAEWDDDEILQEVLAQGVDLSSYARQIEAELKEVEVASIQDYIRENDNLKRLHVDIRSCDAILERMEDMLGGFQEDLASISTEIRSLQTESVALNIKLRNRKGLEAKLGTFVDQMVLPPDLIHNIFHADIDEAYMEHLKVLRIKLTYFGDDPLGGETTRAHREMAAEIEKLKAKATLRVREFLLQSINKLKKAQTNVQVIQQNALLRFKYLLEFLHDVGPVTYEEVRGHYIATMSKLYHHNVQEYAKSLMKLSERVPNRDLVLAAPVPVVKKAKAGAENVSESSAFEVGDRGVVLDQMENDAIIYHVAAKNKQRFSYEQLWRSIMALFSDIATSEFLFCEELFGARQASKIFVAVFDKAQGLLQDHLRKNLLSSNDGIAMLLVAAINHKLQELVERKRVFALDRFFDSLKMLLWPAFKSLFDRHVASLKDADFSDASGRLSPTADCTPHLVATRYSSFASGCLTLGLDPTMLHQNMWQLRKEVGVFFERLAELAGASKTVFLVVNYHCVCSRFAAGNVDSEDVGFFEDLRAAQVAAFVAEVLGCYFGYLVDFEEASGTAGIETVVKQFASGWKSGLQAVKAGTDKAFADDAELNKYMVKQVLQQLMGNYTRFLGELKSSGGKFKEVVQVQTVMFELKKL